MIIPKKSLLFVLPFFLLSCGGTPQEATTEEEPSIESSIAESSSAESNTSAADTTSLTSEEESSEEQPAKMNPIGEPSIARQYYLNHIGDIYSVWDHYRGTGVTIAVIDAGFNPNHPDFFDNDGYSKVSNESAAFVTDSTGTKTKVGVNNVVNMGESHGTFCAGVAAAALNHHGVIGIAPDATLLLLKTDLKPKSIVAAFRYAADHGARVVTISIGSYANYEGDLVNDGSDLPTVFNDAVAYCYNKGVPVISAAGNGGGYMPHEYTWPGATPKVIGVGGLAANSSGEIWEGSSFNSSSKYQFCDVFAPSDGMYGCCHYDGKEYDSGWNGTSFAAPQVAGLAALYFEKNPSKTAADFEKDLYESCHKITTSSIANADQLGYGRIDVAKLLGVEPKEEVTVHVKSYWSNVYCYAWNLDSQREKKAWPGMAMTKDGNNMFSIKINPKEFDSLLFTQGSNGPQTVDITVTSFKSEPTYSLLAPVTENDRLIGNYQFF